MKLAINNKTRILLVLAFLAVSVYGFMVKLPAVFRHHDKQLHTAFYFLAAFFLNLLFTNKKILIHLLIFGALYLLGVCIEYAQEYSNKLFHEKIHGRYDVADVEANLEGLLAYSVLWVVYIVVAFAWSKTHKEKPIKTAS